MLYNSTSLLGKNIKLWGGEGNAMAMGMNITWKKGKGEAISSSLKYWGKILGRISSGEQGNGLEISVKEIKIKKMGKGKNIKL